MRCVVLPVSVSSVHNQATQTVDDILVPPSVSGRAMHVQAPFQALINEAVGLPERCLGKRENKSGGAASV